MVSSYILPYSGYFSWGESFVDVKVIATNFVVKISWSSLV